MALDHSRAILPDPPDQLKRLSAELARRIAGRIESGGPMPFSTYMEAVLYEPGLGYYSAGLPKLGPEGDFVTAPELGNLFARCLSHQIEEIASTLGDWDLLEVGAGSGALAADLLTTLNSRNPPGRYRILERSADLRAVQKQTLGQRAPDMLSRVEWLDEPPREAWRGILIANEVVDALPVERFEVTENGIARLSVDRDGQGFTWRRTPMPEALLEAVERLLGSTPDAFAPGYRSEICALLPGWLQAVSEELEHGVALFIDYGYPRSSYYLPERRDGTLICHYRHRAHADPFIWPGLQDVSAFVDFTGLAEAGDACGLDCIGYTSQAMFLLGCGLERELAGMERLGTRERLARAREVRELTLPEAMGEKFQCMALGRGYEATPTGFAESDLRSRL